MGRGAARWHWRILPAMMLVAAPVPASAMNVHEFLAKVGALEKMGMRAMFSRDAGLLKTELETAGKSLKAENDAAIAAGKRSSYCPPKKVKMTPKELVAHFRAIPAGQRLMSVKDGLHLIMRREYPCAG